MSKKESAFVSTASCSAHTTSKTQEKIVALHAALEEKRHGLRRRRNVLNQERDKLAGAEGKFMSLAGEFLEDNILPNPDEAEIVLKELTSTRNIYDRLLDDYERAETDYEVAEDNYLEKAERLQNRVFSIESSRSSSPRSQDLTRNKSASDDISSEADPSQA